MKKNSFWKSIGILFAFVFVLSWFIPTGSMGTGSFVKGAVNPLGIIDLVRVPVSIISNYINYGIYVLAIGGLYGVLNFAGVYSPAVDFIVKKFKKKPLPYLIGTVIFFALVSSLTALGNVLFIFVPFFVTILVKLDYKKVTAVAATVGSIIVGAFASLYGFSINGYLNYYLELSVHQDILVKVMLLVLSVGLFVMFLMWDSEKNKIKDEKDTDLALYEKKDSKKKILPLIFVISLMFVFLLIAGFNWRYMSNITLFEDMYTELGKIKIGDYAIINNIIGQTNPLGWWGISETVIVLVFMSALLGWIYGLKIKEIYKSFADGAKEMIKPAIYVIAANVTIGVIAYTGYNSSPTMYVYLANAIMTMSKTFNVFATFLYALVSGIFFNDVSSVVNESMQLVTKTVTTTKDYHLIAIIVQMVHGILMMFLPTSLFLAGALAYAKVSYIDWLKFIWKFLLVMFGLLIIVLTILLLI